MVQPRNAVSQIMRIMTKLLLLLFCHQLLNLVQWLSHVDRFMRNPSAVLHAGIIVDFMGVLHN